jgi:bifunctional DNA-binding transcriptional regulator/antitoxin component of YhaV-PrlF toxin-antitoxin module
MKLTAKRQATLPVGVCKDLGIKPGDEIFLEKQNIDGDTIWVLRPKSRPSHNWFGRLRQYAQNKDHDMEVIRSSIGSGVGAEK